MIFLCFSYNLNHALGWTLVHSLWQAFAIAIITGVALIFLQKKASKIRYFVANVGLFSLLIVALATFALYYDFSKEAGEIVFIQDTFSVLTPVNNLEEAQNTIQSTNFERGLSWQGMKNYCNNNMYLIVTLWFMGVVFFLLKLLGSISYVYYLKNRLNFPAEEYWQETLDKLREKSNLSQYIELVESALVRSPLVVGHLKPMILFPIGIINRLNTNEVEAILAHELAHVMRHDYLFNILQSVIEALFYFHPAVWWMSSQIRTERENCCDDIAIELCGNSLIYAKALVSVQEMAYFSPQLAMAFAGNNRKKQLLLRIQRVLNQPKSKVNIMEKFATTAILLFLVAGLAFGGSRNNNDAFGFFNSKTNTENADNQEDTNQDKYFIKYNVNGETDSLPVDQKIKDGQYNFVNSLYDVDMTVKNQRVTTFKINGLDVDGKDFPKFERMINELVSAKQEDVQDHQQEEMQMSNNTHSVTYNQMHIDADNVEFKNGNAVSFLGDGKITLVKDNKTSTLTLDENGGRFLTVKNNKGGEPITVTLSKDNKIIRIGGINANLAALRKLDWTVTDNGLQPIGGFPNIQPMPPVPPVPPVPAYDNNGNIGYNNQCNTSTNRQECIQRYEKEIRRVREASNKATQRGVEARDLADANRVLADIERDLHKRNVDFADIEVRLEDAKMNIDQLRQDARDAKSNNRNKGNGAETNSSHADISFTYSDDGDEGGDSDDGDEGATITRSSSNVDGKRSVTSTRKGNDNGTEVFDEWLEKELVRDGYIKSVKRYNFVWTDVYMRVAGKNVSDEHRKKYLQMYKKMMGKDMGKTFHITRNRETE
jgi:beta-lactamase regulating signal transducer with metallopeptidase domain